jgi:hypothetical protein
MQLWAVERFFAENFVKPDFLWNIAAQEVNNI